METGLSFTATMRVTPVVTAEYIGSGDLAVLATPAMCALMENAAIPDGKSTAHTKQTGRITPRWRRMKIRFLSCRIF